MKLEKILASIGALVLAGNIATNLTLKNIEDDGVLPTASITSKVLGVELKRRCYQGYNSANYTDGTCVASEILGQESDGELSGTWCCETTPEPVNEVSNLKRNLAVYLGGSEQYIGLGLLGIAGLLYLTRGERKQQ